MTPIWYCPLFGSTFWAFSPLLMSRKYDLCFLSYRLQPSDSEKTLCRVGCSELHSRVYSGDKSGDSYGDLAAWMFRAAVPYWFGRLKWQQSPGSGFLDVQNSSPVLAWIVRAPVSCWLARVRVTVTGSWRSRYAELQRIEIANTTPRAQQY